MACLVVMMAGLDQTGKLFEQGDYFVPELMMAANSFFQVIDLETNVSAESFAQAIKTHSAGFVKLAIISHA